MSGLMNAVVIVAVAVLVIARQFRATRIGTDRRWWLVPAVLAFIALREPGLIDPHHQVEASVLLGTELVIGLAIRPAGRGRPEYGPSRTGLCGARAPRRAAPSGSAGYACVVDSSAWARCWACTRTPPP